MTTKIYDEVVHVDESLDSLLKKAFVNNLLVYNYCLSVLYKNPEMSFQSLRKKAERYIDKENLYPIIKRALHNELYYQYKKFRLNVRSQKTLTSIQYLTFVINSYNNVCFTVNKDRTELNLIELPGTIKLNTPLPELNGETDTVYVNLSYGTKDNAYRINMYSTK